MEHYNIKGRIKALNEKGFGFFIPDNQSEPFITRDIFFHAVDVVGMGQDLNWGDLIEGQRVEAKIVVVTNKGYQAFEVDVKMSTKKNHNFVAKTH